MISSLSIGLIIRQLYANYTPIFAHAAGRLNFFGDHAHLADKGAFATDLPLAAAPRRMSSKRPFAGPGGARLIARYTRHLVTV
jgi:hypothetical protein